MKGGPARPEAPAQSPPLPLRHPVRTLAAAALLLFLSAVLALGSAERLHHGGTTAPGAASARAEELLTSQFRAGNPTVTLVATAPRVDDPAAVRAGTALTARARGLPRVVSVRSYWTERDPNLRGRSGSSALVLLRVATSEATALRDVEPVVRALTGRHGPLTLAATGPTPVGLAIERQSRTDLLRTEILAAPLAAAVLVAVFGSATAALLALLLGLTAVAAATALLGQLARYTEVSVIALNLTTALGFALTIDFSLFLLSRYREERRRTGCGGRSDRAALAAALATAVRTTGRAVVCSALTVVAGLSALFFFPQAMLRSVAYGGIAVVCAGALLALTALPAALLLVGPRIDRRPRRTRGRRPARGPDPVQEGRWYRAGQAVMRRPLAAALASAALLGALVLPFAGVRFGTFDDRALPAATPERRATDTLRTDFDYLAFHPLQVVLPGLTALPGPTGPTGPTGERADARALDGYARRLSTTPHVTAVHTATGSYAPGRLRQAPGPQHRPYASAAGTWAAVVTDVGPETPEGADTARAVRAVPAPVPVLVGGTQAWLAELQDGIGGRLPAALAFLAAATLPVLAWCTRSLLLPLKALALNLLSLTAAFGVLVLVFQQGYGRRLLGEFAVTGVTDTLVPVLVLCVAFGVSMDYEVLLLSRTAEEHAAGATTREAVARAVQRTAGLFTASALVLTVVMAALAASDLLLLKVVGVTLAVAVAVDATLIRLVLAPALIALMGRANWWLPTLPAGLRRRGAARRAPGAEPRPEVTPAR
ncbi:MMPL family transporter [Streptomyces sp. NPDC048337]|uniref:MMPL family transporter n=1 Tax=Streptomyces sp. NPDC048337 TaxID=3365535 RepID=UPI003719896C